MKRITACFCTFLILCVYAIVPVYASQIENILYSDEATLNRIDELYDLRAVLTLDIESNHEHIEKIDEELATLGVQEVSYAYVASKVIGDASPCVTPPTFDGVIWTKHTTTISYYGKMYEIESIVGTLDENNPGNSPLRSFSNATASKQNFSANSILGCTLDIGVSLVGDVISDELPVISTILSTGQTLYSMYSSVSDAYSDPFAVINNVTCSYEITMVSTMRYVFIKPQGTATEGNQILGYAGNKTNCRVECSKPSGRFETGPDGERYEIQDESLYYDSIKSKGYDNAYNMAGKNMYNYRELGYYEHQLEIRNYIRSTTVYYLVENQSGQAANQQTVAFPLLILW